LALNPLTNIRSIQPSPILSVVEWVAVTLRKIPAALALGLVAAFVAHAGLFGGQHAMGGSYDGLLTDLACFGAVGLATLAAAATLAGVRFAADGSVIAARIERHLPGLFPVVVSTVAWFALGEGLESAHAVVALPLAIVALALAAFLVLAVTRAVVRWIAAVAIAIARAILVDLRPAVSFAPAPLAVAPRNPFFRRRFARPPPSLLTIVSY
jgi:hypothetical protein